MRYYKIHDDNGNADIFLKINRKLSICWCAKRPERRLLELVHIGPRS